MASRFKVLSALSEDLSQVPRIPMMTQNHHANSSSRGSTYLASLSIG